LSEEAGTRLRLARLARGRSQRDLASAAGVTRQAVAAIEAGTSEPSLRVALALAQALGTSVEALFGSRAEEPPLGVDTADDAPLRPGDRVALAGTSAPVALALVGEAALSPGFKAADATCVASNPPLVRRLGTSRRRAVVVAGCDPALALVEHALWPADPEVAFRWWPAATDEALRLLAAGVVDAAGVHHDRADPHALPEAIRRAGLSADAVEVLGFSAWQEGLLLRPDLAARVRSPADLAGRRLVNRDRGSEARRLLERSLLSAGLDPGELEGFETEVRSHLLVSAALAAGLGEVGIGAEPAARAFSLGFVPLAEEHFDLVVRSPSNARGEVAGFVELLGSGWLADQLQALSGYGAARLGEAVELAPR
jgi:putative molybdopterin biosynthesis protein